MADTDNDPPTDSDPVPPGELEADTSLEESPDETEDESAEPAARASSAGTDGSGSGESGSGGAEASGSGSDSDSHAGSGGSGSGDSNAASENTTDASGSHREHHGSNPFGKPSEPDDAPPRLSFIQRVRRRLNIYSLAFILIILIAVAIALVTYEQSRRAASNQVKTQGISQSTLEQLANSDATVGSNQTVLNVKSSAIFAGQVLIKQGLEVAGDLKIGGTASFGDINAAGTSQFGQVTVNKDLAVAGNTALQGTATVAKSLQVGGGGTFSGPLSAPQITTGSLQLNGDLVLTHHIHIGGSQPGRSDGSALGGGGSASVSGSDTAGAITINTGSGPAAGCFITVNFASHFSSTPYVQVTPVGSAAGSLSYYINRTTTGFSVCDATTPPAGSSFGFDYFVVD